VGTLSKAIGAMGGYVAGTQALREVMINRARPFLFSTAHPPSVAATCIKALELLQTDPSLHARLWENTHRFKAGLRELGFQIESETPITPVIVGTAEKAQRFSQRLFECGIYGQAIVFPTVAADKARVRFILSATHEAHHLDKALNVILDLKTELALC
jgi:glycine C-acetyltransferase